MREHHAHLGLRARQRVVPRAGHRDRRGSGRCDDPVQPRRRRLLGLPGRRSPDRRRRGPPPDRHRQPRRLRGRRRLDRHDRTERVGGHRSRFGGVGDRRRGKHVVRRTVSVVVTGNDGVDGSGISSITYSVTGATTIGSTTINDSLVTGARALAARHCEHIRPDQCEREHGVDRLGAGRRGDQQRQRDPRPAKIDTGGPTINCGSADTACTERT